MPQWTWPDSLDALIAAPAFHRLLLENERVRVLDVRIAPGQVVPVHTHKWPSIVHVQSTSDFIRRDGEGKVIFDSRAPGVPKDPAVVQWLPPLPPHSVENVGTSEIHLFTVELKEPHGG
jgi:predicted metal-dependent enzyme (double-stranded beta helix superfamily)